MKRKLTIAFIMIAILLTACKPKYETKTIMNRFTVSYPEDWKLSENEDGSVTIYSGHLTTERVVFFRYSSGHEFENLLKGWQSTDSDDTITNVKFETKKFDSHDAFYVEYVLKDLPDSKVRKIFILLNSRVYSISEHSSKGGTDEKELEKIVASISLKDSSTKIFEVAE